MRGVSKGCKRALDSSASDAELGRCRTALQMAVFLHSWVVQEAEKQHSKAGVSATTSRARKESKNKQGAAEDDNSSSWGSLRESAALHMLEVRPPKPSCVRISIPARL